MTASRLSAAILAMACLSGPVAAQSATGPSVADPVAGSALFLRYCVACHGPEGRGDGPMSEILTVQPTDLTALAAGNGGVFPVVRAIRQIDGRDPLLAHGGVMPLFGDFFAGGDTVIASEAGQPIMTSQAIADVMAWLASVQE